MNLSILDMPRAYTAIAEWLAVMLFALSFPPRQPRRNYAVTALCALAVQTVFLVVTDDISLYLWLPCMMMAVGMMLGWLLLLCDISVKEASYACVRAFILAEFAAAIEWQIHRFFWPVEDPVWWQQHGLMLLVFGGIFLVMWLLEQRSGNPEQRLVITWHELLTVCIIGICVFAISNLSFYVKNSPFSSHYASEIMNIRTLVDFAGVAVLYAYHVLCRQTQARKELGTMQAMLESQYAQYKMSRESIELINRKYHDLKHIITALRSEPDQETRARWLDEIEADIRTYEAQNKTGNTILDTLLTGKSLYCQKHGIELSVVADGESIAFMDVMDICTIFGNALDNAIECELKIPEKEKRMIHLRLTTQKRFVLLQVEDYCPQRPEFQGGLPVTTKSDSFSHGFGLKSIQYTARKYGGTTTVQADGGWFVLKVLIPLRSGI